MISDPRSLFNFPGAVFLPELLVTKDRRLALPVSTAVGEHDVTGGIELKLTSAVDIVCDSDGEVTVIVCGLDTTDSKKVLTSAYSAACCHGDLGGEKGTVIRATAGEEESQNDV